MISPKNYIYRFLEYLILNKAEAFEMKAGLPLDDCWRTWAKWLFENGSLRNLSTGQVGQDLFAAYILEKEFDTRVQDVSGSFLEFGAFDGVRHSNSYLFERLGWMGVLVEPDPGVAGKCRGNRAARVIQACVMGNNFKADSVAFDAVEEDGELSSVSGYGKPGAKMMNSHRLNVPVVRLDELLVEMGVVDILSMDVEGTELELLQNSEFPVRPRIVVVEHNNSKPVRNAIQQEMQRKSYGRFDRFGDFFDDFYCDSLASR